MTKYTIYFCVVWLVASKCTLWLIAHQSSGESSTQWFFKLEIDNKRKALLLLTISLKWKSNSRRWKCLKLYEHSSLEAKTDLIFFITSTLTKNLLAVITSYLKTTNNYIRNYRGRISQKKISDLFHKLLCSCHGLRHFQALISKIHSFQLLFDCVWWSI